MKRQGKGEKMEIKEFEKNLFEKIMNRKTKCVTECIFLFQDNRHLVQNKHIKAVLYYCTCWECRNELQDLFVNRKKFSWSKKDDPNQLELIPEENFFDQFEEKKVIK